jgi:hypothetical protein
MAGDFGLSPEVRRLIASQLASMDHVEVLLLLHRSAPAAVTQVDAARETRRPVELLTTVMTDLVNGGLASRAPGPGGDDTFAYAPQSESLRRDVEQLVAVYNERPVTLIRAVYDRPPEPVKSFADAFRLRKD